MKRKIRVFDNGGETFDRYTIVIDNNVYGMSDNADQANGFNQYIGELGLDCNESNLNSFDNNQIELKQLPSGTLIGIINRLEIDNQSIAKFNIKWNGELGEYKVICRIKGSINEARCYYTNDYIDALKTRNEMEKEELINQINS